MNAQILSVILALVLVCIASFFINLGPVINALDEVLTLGVNVVTGILMAIVGGMFYILIRIAGLFSSDKVVEDFVFYDIKEALEANKFTHLDIGAIKKINALLRLTDESGDGYYIIVNDDFRTVHGVSPCGLMVAINQNSIRFMQNSFLNEQDLVNYINSRTRQKVTKFELIVDSIEE